MSMVKVGDVCPCHKGRRGQGLGYERVIKHIELSTRRVLCAPREERFGNMKTWHFFDELAYIAGVKVPKVVNEHGEVAP